MGHWKVSELPLCPRIPANYMQGNEYEIYEQKETPEIDMYTHLPLWIEFLERNLLGRALEADDYIFPHISVNGIVQPKKEMTHEAVQKLITDISLAARIERTYTTHSFRRGGAQYRFMFAPISERWSLSIIRWWGGWSIGEHVRPNSSL
jgi:hypothetical protein